MMDLCVPKRDFLEYFFVCSLAFNSVVCTYMCLSDGAPEFFSTLFHLIHFGMLNSARVSQCLFLFLFFIRLPLNPESDDSLHSPSFSSSLTYTHSNTLTKCKHSSSNNHHIFSLSLFHPHKNVQFFLMG